MALRALYTCTTQEFYSIAETGWQNCSDNLADFTTFKKFYDAPYVAAKQAAIAAAKLLPDAEARVGEHEVERVQLQPLLLACLDNFQRLGAYIQDAFPKSEWKARKENAGGNYYSPASRENWENCVAMNNAMNTFISDNLAALTAGNNMPATFQADVSADATDYLMKYNSFKSKRQTAPDTDAKTLANNDCHRDLMKMFDDGVTIYRSNPAKQGLFTFSTIKNLASPPGSASLKVTVITLPDNAAAPNAAISMQAEGGLILEGLTNSEGVFSFENIDPGVYKGTVTLDGYVVFVFTKDVNTGTDARLDVELVKLV